ncbi:hypothetical protein OH807_15210 [Kitasatospora sp. NBC_01560]|uniref:hypothetical protein n=1 Tax=Kitasatospora sp. NBC_01560 TaxID=2975965 RepID=UPI0038653F4C
MPSPHPGRPKARPVVAALLMLSAVAYTAWVLEVAVWLAVLALGLLRGRPAPPAPSRARSRAGRNSDEHDRAGRQGVGP